MPLTVGQLGRHLGSFVFAQPAPQWRAGTTRWSLAAAAAITVRKLPPGTFFEEHRATVGALSHGTDRQLGASEYEKLRTSTISALAWWAATGSRPAGLAAAAQYARLSAHVAAFFPRVWSYNAHLSIFMVVLGALDTSTSMTLVQAGKRRASDDRMQSMALAFMQSYVGMLYLQSAVSKLRYGGADWVRTGRTVRGSVALFGTRLGRRLLHSPKLASYASCATLTFEALFLPALLAGWPNRRVLAAVAMGGHIAAAATLRISFWHLWALYPALFLLPSPAELNKLRHLLRPGTSS